jgi:hypothetical protein
LVEVEDSNEPADGTFLVPEDNTAKTQEPNRSAFKQDTACIGDVNLQLFLLVLQPQLH